MIAQNSTTSRRWTHLVFALVACNMLLGLAVSHAGFPPLPGSALNPINHATERALEVATERRATLITTASLATRH